MDSVHRYPAPRRYSCLRPGGQGELRRATLDREPAPEAVVDFLDQLQHFLERLSPEERQILELRLQGFSNEEVAKKLGVYERKVRRILERLRGRADQ